MELLKTCKTSKTKKLLTVDAEWSPNLLGSLTWVKKKKSLSSKMGSNVFRDCLIFSKYSH